MATRRQLQKRCDELGCILDFRDFPQLVRLDPPPGKVFAGLQVHYLDKYRSDWQGGMGSVWPELYRQLLEDIELGLEDCPFDDCDICAENCSS